MEFLGKQLNNPPDACGDPMLCQAMVLGVNRSVTEGTPAAVMGETFDRAISPASRCGEGCTIIAAQLALKNYQN